MDLENCFSDEIKAALSLLTENGFTPLIKVKVEDCRELGTGLRRRTFRNRGKYDLCLCMRKLPEVVKTAKGDPDQETKPDETETPEASDPDPDEE